MSEKTKKYLWWMRAIMLLVVGLANAVAGFKFSWLPEILPSIGVAASTLGTVIAVWISSLLPNREQEEKEEIE